jgi:hypothetical protein
VIADPTVQMQKYARGAGLAPFADEMGFFGCNPEYRCWVTVLSYDKVVADARRRIGSSSTSSTCLSALAAGLRSPSTHSLKEGAGPFLNYRHNGSVAVEYCVDQHL